MSDARYAFGDWQVDGGLNELRRGAEVKKLQPRAMDVLIHLLTSAIDNPTKVVTTASLLEEVWPDRVVEESAVQQRINMIRKALGDDARNPTYIAHVKRRGYRTLAAVRRAVDEGSVYEFKRPTVAVLPFVNLDGDEDRDYFGDGLADDLITELTRIPLLKVVARHSSFAFRGSGLDVREVGAALNSDYLLQGSIRRSRDSVRVTAQLSEQQTGHQVWADRFDRSLQDVFSLQDELCGEIVTALDVKLATGERARHRRTRISNTEAGDALYRGLSHHAEFNKPSNALAIDCFAKVISLEPESIVGYVHSAFARQQEIIMGWSTDTEGSIAKLGDNVERALAIEPNEPFALGYAGMHQLLLGNHDAAVNLAQQAVDFAPHLDGPLYTLGWYQMFSGDPRAGASSIQRSMAMVPVNTAPRISLLGTCYRNAGEIQAAIPVLEDSVSSDPDFIFARAVLASTYALDDRLDDARGQVDAILARNPHYTVTRYLNPNLYREGTRKIEWANALRSAGLPE